MKIWILNHYATNMKNNKGGRHYWFAKFLNQEGHQPVVFCARSEDNTNAVELAEDIHTPFVYVNIQGDRKRKFSRIRSMLSFYSNVQKVAKQYAKTEGKPDVILASSVHPLTLVAGLKLAKHFKVKCICEMRDMWPEAIFAYSRLKGDSLIGKLLYRGEKWIYSKADALIFTQEGGADYIRAHKWDLENGGPIDMSKVYHINNGVDLQAFDQNAREFVYEDADLDNPELYKIVYAGALGPVNDIDLILDTAKLITDPKIKFLIFGDGGLLPKLQQRLIDEEIDNVVFKGRVNKQFIPSIDCRADLNLAHWKMTPLVVRMGESCNKVFEYCAAGKPIFYTVRPSYGIAEKFDCGIVTDGFSAVDLARGIMECVHLPQERKEELSRNARKAAEYYDFKNLTKQLLDIIKTVSAKTEESTYAAL